MFILLTTPSVINYIMRSIRKDSSLVDVIKMFKENGYDLDNVNLLYNYELKGDTECAYIENLIARLILYAPILNLYGLGLTLKNDKFVNYEKYTNIESYTNYDLKRLEERKVIKKKVLRKEDNNE